jgi:hypothetical protein
MKKILFLLILNLFLIINISYAQMTYELVSGGGAGIQDPFPINKDGSASGRFLGYAFDMVIGISIALAVIIFMVGAFGNIFGEVSIGSHKANKDMMKNSVVGLIITLSFYLILQTINPDLVKFPLFSNLDINGVKSAGGGSPSATVK